ncbi:prominin-1-A-like [Acyrthosiphon pisum]|uniref:Prominin n=1 Tax=Acyrthosiphon pisum TaxID=7029 RepID=A0A8R2A9W6_ACYPI|nr:prominin-1-A-like [Acyrthosiphon pisum]|eukprot:XP_003242766.1 PREDICTED: prominin-1-A-like [Acyrthosiphon pisum]
MERPPSLLSYIYCATSCLLMMSAVATAATVTVNVTHLCDKRPLVASARSTTDIGMTSLPPLNENLTTETSSSLSPTENPTSWSSSTATENLASWPTSLPVENLTSRLSPPSFENQTTVSPPLLSTENSLTVSSQPLTDNQTSSSPPPTDNQTSSSPPLTNNRTSSSPLTDNRTSSAARVTEFLLAVRKPGIMGFTYASRTAMRRSSSSPDASTGPVALEQIAAFPSAKFRENVKLDQQTSRSDSGEGSGTAAAIGLFGVGIVVGDVGLRFIGVAEDAVMWHSVPAELILDLFSNPYEWDVVAKKILPYEWPLAVVCALMIFCGLILARYGVYWQRRYKEAKWLGDTGWESGCKKGVLVIAIQMLLLMLGAGACGLLVTNETMGSAVSSVGDLLEFGVGDLVDMFSITQKQIRTITVGSMDSTTDAIFSKLDDIAEQLGGPIENDIYGPSHRFGSRNNVSRVVQDFQKIFPKARDVISQAELVREDIIRYNKQIVELNVELQMLPERCPLEVSAMCDMISGNKLHPDNYTYLDDLINVVRGVLEVENDGLSSLPLTSAESANIPRALYEQTEKERWRIKQALMDRRRQLEFSIYPYESHTRKLVSKLMDMKETANNYFMRLKQIEAYRWSASIGIAIAALLIWILLACSIVVNYCSHTTWAKCYFFGCVSTMRLTSLVLWISALLGLILSSNGEVNICRPLYDEPMYETVTKIMDCPAITNERGFFSWFIFGNETSTAPFNEVIESCRENRTAHATFNLNKVFNVDASSDYNKWPGLMDALDSLKTKRVRVELDLNRPPSTADALRPIAESTNLDFEKFRSLILESSLALGRVTLLRDQLRALSTQTASFSNMFKVTLKRVVTNITDLVENVMSPMSQKKNMLLYHLTLMEVEMQPLSESLNRTWANAYTRIENSDFDQILRKNMAQYTNNLKVLLDKYKVHVTEAVKTEAASCRPVWNVYRIGRDLVCRQALDALNGFWLICFFIAMSVTVAIPVVKNLKIFHKSPLTSMSLYTIPPPPAMELMSTSS